MRFPQLIIYETDGRLARMLEATAGTHRWALRQPRRIESCLQLMRGGGPAIVVVKVENDLESALTLIERALLLFPDADVVVVLDRDEAVLSELAWDLGACYVLAPPQPRDRLLDVVANLMGDVPNGDDPI
jgi:ActR/RegA family two-component response regulator